MRSHPRVIVIVAGVAGAALLAPRAAQAQDVACPPGADFPCALQIEEIGVRPVPALFKLQARVSQAKIPVGEGTFKKVVVKLVSGTEVLCAENFRDVQVRDGVLNLAVGENVDCDLVDTIARHGDLTLQACLGDEKTCLPGIPLAPAPYAVKSGSAGLAQNAHRADHAAQAHYAHRLAADADLQTTRALSAGYLDFESAAGESGGSIAWAPAAQRSALNLHLAQRSAAGALSALEHVVFAADETRIEGNASVARTRAGEALAIRVDAGGLHVTGASSIDGTLQISDRMTVNAAGAQIAQGPLDVTGDALVRGNVDIAAPLTTAGSLTVLAGGLHVQDGVNATGDASIVGDTTAQARVTLGSALTVTQGGLGVSQGRLSSAGAARFRNGLDVDGRTTALAGVHIGGGGFVVSAGDLRVGGGARFGNLDVRGGFTLSSESAGDLEIAQSLTAGELHVSGDADVTGDLELAGRLLLRDGARAEALAPVLTVSGTPGAERVQVGAANEIARVRLFADATLARTLAVQGGSALNNVSVTGGANANGTSTLRGGATFGDAADDEVALDNGATFTAADPAAFTTRVEGATSVSGQTRLTGGATFDTAVTFNGAVRYTTERACPIGLLPDGNGRCSDIDECATGRNDCWTYRYCVNTYGGFKCVNP